MKPVGGRVFIQRDPEMDELMGFKVGDRAKAKAVTGVVITSGSDMVRAGDRVHLPHQEARAMDYEIDGTEVAVVKEADLFCIEEDNAFRPINRYVKVRKCLEDDIRDESGAIALHMTDVYKENTYWVEILEYADDCVLFPKQCLGWFCIAPECDERLQRCERTDDFFLHEELIPFITDGN